MLKLNKNVSKLLYTFKIRGLDFKFVMFHPEAFALLHPDSEAAVTSMNEIHVPSHKLSLTTLRHEVTHAYCNSCLYDSASDISMRDMEEIFCDLIGYFGPEIIETTNKLYKIYKKETK